jgi:tryptophanyl-tRNA synthetase
MRTFVHEMVVDWLSAGLDPEKAVLFQQSHLPEHAVLHLLFSMITPLPWLERVPTYKEKMEQIDDRDMYTYGFLGYPVLQAADILIYKGEVVPVGEDQVQHVEFTREVARRFNARFGDTFPECEALLTASPRIMGLDGQAKMSKSKGNAIGLLESREEIWAKLSVAPTDPARVRRSDPGTPEKCNIYSYHRLVTPEPQLSQTVAQGCRTAGIGCIDCKRILLDNLMKELDPIRARHQELASRPQKLRQALDANAASCRADAGRTILEVKEKMGLARTWKI